MRPSATLRLTILLSNLSFPVLLASTPPATVVGPIVEDLDAKAIFCVILELPFVHSAVCVHVLSLAFALLMLPIAFIVAPIRVDETALPMDLSKPPLPFVQRPIGPDLDTMAVAILGFLVPLSLIDHTTK